jgi:hypothetical protein
VLPAAAQILATADADARPVVWRAPLGAGRVVVSGALDAWRYRVTGGSAFDDFWRETIAAAAAATPPPVDVWIDRTSLAPGGTAHAEVMITAAALEPGGAVPTPIAPSAVVEGPAGASPVRLWPTRQPGRLVAELRAPAAGAYRLVVTNGGDRGDAVFTVREGSQSAVAGGRALTEAWTRAHGGAAVDAGRPDDLDAALDRATRAEWRDERWHPMRSAWWILPFAALLGVEWTLRRTRGMR